MMMIIGPRQSSGAHDFRAPREWRAPMKVFFQGEMSVDSWTLGPKPLCHRRPTGPHPSGLLWTPANGDSTKSNFALGEADVAVGIVLADVDVLVGQRVEPDSAKKRLLGLDQQDGLGETRIVEAAAEVHARLDGEDLELVGTEAREVGRVHDLRQVLAENDEIVLAEGDADPV